jgi:hypothetical protein
MKVCKICVLDIEIDIDIHHIPFQCGDKLPENENEEKEKEKQKEKEKHQIEPDKEKPKVLNPFEINCICAVLGQS